MKKHPRKDEMLGAIRDLLNDGHPKSEIKDYILNELKDDPDLPTFQTIYDWIKDVSEDIQKDGWICEKEQYRNNLVARKKKILADWEFDYDNESDPIEKRKIGRDILKHSFMKNI